MSDFGSILYFLRLPLSGQGCICCSAQNMFPTWNECDSFQNWSWFISEAY